MLAFTLTCHVTVSLSEMIKSKKTMASFSRTLTGWVWHGCSGKKNIIFANMSKFGRVRGAMIDEGNNSSNDSNVHHK